MSTEQDIDTLIDSMKDTVELIRDPAKKKFSVVNSIHMDELVDVLVADYTKLLTVAQNLPINKG